ncbi:MAG: hypothetical protein LOD87_01705 [Planifilum fulgidum]
MKKAEGARESALCADSMKASKAVIPQGKTISINSKARERFSLVIFFTYFAQARLIR